MPQRQYNVAGMTFEHHVTDLDDTRLRAAIVEAGYSVADSVAA